MKWSGLILFCLSEWILFTGQNEFYSSTEDMLDLLAVGRVFIHGLSEDITEEVSEDLHSLKSILEEFEKVDGDSNEDLEKLISHPLIAFMVTRRLWFLVGKINNILSSNGVHVDVRLIYKNLPSETDVVGIALGLFGLQELYKMEAQSIIGGMPTGVSAPDPDELFHLAEIANQNLKSQCAFQWLQEAHRELIEGQAAYVTEADVLGFQAQLAFEMGNLPIAMELNEKLLDQNPSDVMASQRLEYYRVLTDSVQNITAEFNHFQSNEDLNSYKSLCRGEDINMTPSRQRALSCRYSTVKGNPHLIYAPIKEEEEWDDPRIIRFHDLISDKDINDLKKVSRSKLKRSTVAESSDVRVVQSRVSKSAALYEDEDPVVSRVNKRMADITGLEMQAAEILQVANYGIGGRYEPHYDSWDHLDTTDYIQWGGRIATILIYLTDVEVGGSTVFPEIGAALRPLKGSAVFWYNHLQNGEMDSRTLHAGCPVFVGNKWIGNKWVRERGQEFRRRCSLLQSD